MERLLKAGLFGSGLIAVDTPELVSRYNGCLSELGIEPTSLQEFHIDGIGWSPEIAKEKKNNFYLCAGIANPMGVILTPNQRKKPVYFPFNSYDRAMLEAYFERHHRAIVEITSTVAIGLDIDPELTLYKSPIDLTLVHYINLRSVAGGLFDAAREQRALVEKFTSDNLTWLDPSLLNAICESGKCWGDLRYRRTDIPDFRYDVGSFYTNAFGGVFVLRASKREKITLILEDKSMVSKGKTRGVRAVEEYWIQDSELPLRLCEEGFTGIDLRWYEQHKDVIVDKKDGMLAEVVCGADPAINYAGLKLAQKRQLGFRLADKLPQVYHELERFSRRLNNGTKPNVDGLSRDLKAILMRPRGDLPESEAELIWLLLCRLQPLDVFRLYASDKNRFFTSYTEWPDSKKEWATRLIAERYVPRMSQ